jgi:hypothetical protein
MALNSYTYGTVLGVHRRIGWLNANRTYFDGSTNPTIEQVELTLDQVATEIHANLAKAGYPVSTKATLESSSPFSAKWLALLNEDGAAAFILMSNPLAYDPESAGQNPAKFWQSRYTNGLALLASGFLDDLDLPKTESESSLLYSGSSQDEDGYEKNPLFYRGQFDYPSSRSLTEE